MRIKIKRRASKREKTRRENWNTAQRWLATSTLVAYSAIGSNQAALAQQPSSTGSAPPQDKTMPVIRFEIPAGTLDAVIGKFTEATKWRVETAQPSLLTVASPGVTGLYSPEAALKMLLAKTGVTSRTTAEGVVMLEIERVAFTIDVTAGADALSGSTPKYSGSLRDTPQSIIAVSRQTIEEQGATTLRDTLRNVAGISIAAGEGGNQGDNLTIRGFSARSDLFIDGMRDFGSYYRDPFNTEEVQVLQGPSSVTFGRGSTGGIVNQSTKNPRDSRSFAAEALFGTDETKRGTADVNLPVPALGAGTAFRLNLMGNQGHVAGRDIAENRRYGVAPALIFGLGTRTRWSLNYFHQLADDVPDYGIPWYFNGPAPVNRRNSYGFKDGDFLKTSANIGTVKFDRDVNARVIVHNQLRYANYNRDVRITEPRIAGTFTPATPLSQLSVTRNQLTAQSTETYLDEQLDSAVRFKTAGIEHYVTTGGEVSRETSDPIRFTYAGVPTTPLLNPNPNQPFAGVPTMSSKVEATAYGAAGYVLDRIRLSSKLEFTGGLRYDRFSADYSQSVGTPVQFHRVDNMTSWRTALVYKPVAEATIYAAAGTSFNPSAEALALSAATANLPPEKNRTYEAGVKYDLPRNRMSFSSAVFRTTKLNAREPDPVNATLNVLSGEQRVNGVSINLRGRLTSRWEMMGGYAYLDAQLASSRAFPAAVGARLANVPENTFNFWSSFRFPYRIQFSGGGNYVASRTASSTVPLDPATGLVKALPGYWVFNAMGSKRISEHVELQANFYNIANRYYYDQLHPGHIVLGAGRSALIGFKFKF